MAEGLSMERRTVEMHRSYDAEEPEWTEETKDYRQGSIVIYKEVKRRMIKPAYGYKFIQTDEKK